MLEERGHITTRTPITQGAHACGALPCSIRIPQRLHSCHPALTLTVHFWPLYDATRTWVRCFPRLICGPMSMRSGQHCRSTGSSGGSGMRAQGGEPRGHVRDDRASCTALASGADARARARCCAGLPPLLDSRRLCGAAGAAEEHAEVAAGPHGAPSTQVPAPPARTPRVWVDVGRGGVGLGAIVVRARTRRAWVEKGLCGVGRWPPQACERRYARSSFPFMSQKGSCHEEAPLPCGG